MVVVVDVLVVELVVVLVDVAIVDDPEDRPDVVDSEPHDTMTPRTASIAAIRAIEGGLVMSSL